jgi:hypothetical protein
MKTISQTLIMSWLGKNYQWAMVEGSSGLSALGEGGILKGIKLYSKILILQHCHSVSVNFLLLLP